MLNAPRKTNHVTFFQLISIIPDSSAHTVSDRANMLINSLVKVLDKQIGRKFDTIDDKLALYNKLNLPIFPELGTRNSLCMLKKYAK